ncbi:MAG TPA: DinB family protein [Chitinophaga sp.]
MDPATTQLLQDLDANTSLFLDILDTVPPFLLHAKNDKTEWSIMECAEHMLIMEQAVTRTLQGPTRPLKDDRAPDSKFSQLEGVFLELQPRLKHERPENSEVSYADVRKFAADFRANREAIKQALAGKNIREEFSNYEHPAFGFLTGLEWLRYLVVHTERHLHQINRIESVLTNPPG